MFSSVIALLLLAVVLGFIILRPKNIAIAWPASIGAVIAILFGLISLTTLKTIIADTWDASFTLIALFILAEALNANKFFDWAALHLARISSGSGWKLYFYTLLLTTLATAFLANDGAILILTPIFATLLKKIYPNSKNDWLPYLFAVGFFADAMSATFIPSNLTNILLADAYHLSFGEVVTRMIVPMSCVFIVSGLAFALRFRKRLKSPYSLTHLSSPKKIIRDWFIFWVGICVLGVLILSYIVGGQYHIPTALIALPLSSFMLIIVHVRKLAKAQSIIMTAPWHILIYALGMFVLITAAYSTHSLHLLTQPLRDNAADGSGTKGLFIIGSIIALLSATVNNLPATLISILAIKSVTHLAHLALYAVILGVNIGPKLTPFGSLSTLLWLDLLQKNGITISWRRYIKENWWITLLVLATALIALSFTA